jgi:hypothetical protein
MFKIIKNADLPIGKIRPVYPIEHLEVGDGFDAVDNLGHTKMGHSRRKTGIKNSIARFRRLVNSDAKFVVGLHPKDPEILRCVRTR